VGIRTSLRAREVTRYRLPTETEWECAARAGTSTSFSYGDDSNYSSLANYAWFLDFANIVLTVHPVGQKLPNPWGLYDLAGNKWTHCSQGRYPQYLPHHQKLLPALTPNHLCELRVLA
jgi:formylglycine-generating enzyme required for sulfatase activity